MTPPSEVRKKVSGEHLLDGKCVWWYFDIDTGFGVIADSPDHDFVKLGRSSLEPDKVVTLEAGLVDAAFEYLEQEDMIVFLGTKNSLSDKGNYLFVLHEKQLYELLKPLENQ